MLTASELNNLTPMRGIIYVPVRSGRASTEILPGSGIVGEVPKDGRVVVWYEGNAFGADNLKSYESRIVNAAGRMFERYPTRAMMSVEDHELAPVGIVAWYKGLRPGFQISFGDDEQRQLVRNYLVEAHARGFAVSHERADGWPGYV